MRHLDDAAALTALEGNTRLGKQKVMSKPRRGSARSGMSCLDVHVRCMISGVRHLCMVQALLQVFQVGLWNDQLGPQSPTDVGDAFVHTLKVGMLALAWRPQQA